MALASAALRSARARSAAAAAAAASAARRSAMRAATRLASCGAVPGCQAGGRPAVAHQRLPSINEYKHYMMPATPPSNLTPATPGDACRALGEAAAHLPAPHAGLQRARRRALPRIPPLLLVPAHRGLDAQRRGVRTPQLRAAPPRGPAARARLHTPARKRFTQDRIY